MTPCVPDDEWYATACGHPTICLVWVLSAIGGVCAGMAMGLREGRMKQTRREFVRNALVLLAALSGGCTRRGQSPAITLGVRTSNCQTPFYVAAQREMYRDHGLDARVQLVPSNTEIIEALSRGDMQIGSLPITTAIAAIANGAPIRIVAMSGRGSDGVLVRNADDMHHLSDLAGRKVATIRASILDVLLRYALEEEGLDPETSLDLVYFGTLGDMISALRTSQVDATSNTEPFMTDTERQGWGRILTYYTAYWPDHPCCVVVARDDLVLERQDVLRDVLAVHCAAVDWCNHHRAEAAQILVDTLDAFDRELVESTFDPSKMRLDYAVRAGEAERFASLMARYALVEEAPTGQAMLDLDALEHAIGRIE